MSTKNTLPNAPLSEVVFEVHFHLVGDADTPPPFRSDPGFTVLLDEFTAKAAKRGFGFEKSVGSQEIKLANTIANRFYREEGELFPVWQVGPGIVASNESSSYEWETYKDSCLNCLHTYFDSYPRLNSFKLKPSHIELKYIDIFDLEDGEGIIGFINAHTALNIELPAFFTDKPRVGKPAANIYFDFPLEKQNTKLKLQLTSSSNNLTAKMESSIVTSGADIQMGEKTSSRVKYFDKWLEDAHSITSPLFIEFVDDALMENFRVYSK